MPNDMKTIALQSGTPEMVAYLLMHELAAAEGKSTLLAPSDKEPADRAWLFRAYRDCLRLVARAQTEAGGEG